MTATVEQQAGTGSETGSETEGKSRAGRVLDVAGICAAVVLGVILVDIFSGGKLTRWARDRRGGCQGCGDGEAAPGDG